MMWKLHKNWRDCTILPISCQVCPHHCVCLQWLLFDEQRWLEFFAGPWWELVLYATCWLSLVTQILPKWRNIRKLWTDSSDIWLYSGFVPTLLWDRSQSGAIGFMQFQCPWHWCCYCRSLHLQHRSCLHICTDTVTLQPCWCSFFGPGTELFQTTCCKPPDCGGHLWVVKWSSWPAMLSEALYLQEIGSSMSFNTAKTQQSRIKLQGRKLGLEHESILDSILVKSD